MAVYLVEISRKLWIPGPSLLDHVVVESNMPSGEHGVGIRSEGYHTYRIAHPDMDPSSFAATDFIMISE